MIDNYGNIASSLSKSTTNFFHKYAGVGSFPSRVVVGEKIPDINIQRQSS